MEELDKAKLDETLLRVKRMGEVMDYQYSLIKKILWFFAAIIALSFFF